MEASNAKKTDPNLVEVLNQANAKSYQANAKSRSLDKESPKQRYGEGRNSSQPSISTTSKCKYSHSKDKLSESIKSELKT